MGAGIGAGLGVLVALLWGSADIFVTLTARHIGAIRTILISQFTGVVALFFFGCFVFWFWHLDLTLSLLKISTLIGVFTGLCAALGYYVFYHALEIGPVALVSPIVASSSSFTFLLSILAHQEQTSAWRILCILTIIAGVVLASTRVKEIRQTFSVRSDLNKGIYFSIIAMIAFGFMDFGIGFSASMTGWFLPVLWTRFFSFIFLVLLVALQRSKLFMFTDRKFASLRKVESVPTQLNSGYSIAYQQSINYADPRFLADFPTLVLNTEGHKVTQSRATSLRRVVMVPVTRPANLIFEQPTQPYSKLELTATKPELTATHTNSNKGSRKTWQNLWISIAVIAGIVENAAILIFSLDTRVATIGFASAIASSYSLIGVLFGVILYHERLEKNQIYGILLCILSIFLLAV